MSRSIANETHLLTQRRGVQQLSGDAEDVIDVPASFKIQRGEALIEGVVLGRKLGSGLQVKALALPHTHVSEVSEKITKYSSGSPLPSCTILSICWMSSTVLKAGPACVGCQRY